MDIKVSILIPCYNAERWISQAIESALNQTYPNKEVIVIDDGSTDNSLQIIKTFCDRIQWRTQPNQGGNYTRNHLLEISTGLWLQYLDSDDYLQPEKIEKQLQFLEKNPNVDIIYSPSIYEYHSEDAITQTILPIPEPHDPWILLARWFLPQTGSPLWRKQAIIDVGKWKTDQPCCQEHELYLRLLMAKKSFLYYPEADSVYRQWSEFTVCKKNKPELFWQRLIIEDRLEKYLNTSKKITKSRQYAINQARFECARLIWSFDQPWAKSIIRKIRFINPFFSPSGDSAPMLYKIIFKFIGFQQAENIALIKRRFL